MDLAVVDPALQDDTSWMTDLPPSHVSHDAAGAAGSGSANEGGMDAVAGGSTGPKKRGRPPGSKNKVQRPRTEKGSPEPPKRRGRPKGSKDKPRPPDAPARGRPKGSKNKPRDPDDPNAKPIGRPRVHPVGTTKRDRRKAILEAEEAAMAANGGVLPEDMRLAKEKRERMSAARKAGRGAKVDGRSDSGDGDSETSSRAARSREASGAGDTKQGNPVRDKPIDHALTSATGSLSAPSGMTAAEVETAALVARLFPYGLSGRAAPAAPVLPLPQLPDLPPEQRLVFNNGFDLDIPVASSSDISTFVPERAEDHEAPSAGGLPAPAAKRRRKA